MCFLHCKRCGDVLEDGYIVHAPDNNWYCGDCAFLEGFITEEVLLKRFYHYLSGIGKNKPHAAIIDGKVVVGIGNFDSEYDPTKRGTKEYKEWRTKVLCRDKFTCQACGRVGGNLNVHHIKSYNDFPDLRLDLDNGVTLCRECHMDVHNLRSLSDGK